MKSKIGLLAVVLTSGLLLSACTTQNGNQNQSNNTNSNNQQTQEQNGDNQPSGTPQGRAQGQQPMDLASAAEELGVTEDVLRSALGMDNMAEVTPGTDGTPGVRPSGEPKQMDLAGAAETLGVTEDALKEALGWNGNMPSGAPQQGEMNQNGQE